MAPGASRPLEGYKRHMRALAVIFAAVAVICMILAIAGIVTGRPSDRAGYVIRAIAVVCFAAAVVLNIVAR